VAAPALTATPTPAPEPAAAATPAPVAAVPQPGATPDTSTQLLDYLFGGDQ
jgi:hypothetical protein